MTPPPDPVQSPDRRIEVGLLPFVAGIVGVLLFVGVVGAVLWVTRAGAEPAEVTHTDATQPAGALSGTPDLAVTVEGHVLTWSMDHASLRAGDRFRIRTGPSQGTVTGEPVTLLPGETTYRQTLGAGQEQCGMVQVVRGDGQVSGWSSIKCEKTGG